MADLKTTLAKTFALTPEIESLFCVSTYSAYGDLCSLPFNEKDSNELFLIDELQRIMFRLAEAKDRIDYLKRPVKEISCLHKTANGRYETTNGYVYTSGDAIEALIGDSFHETPYWVRTSVEHDGRKYYLVDYEDIRMEGLVVRRR